jgi:hypothetical protein
MYVKQLTLLSSMDKFSYVVLVTQDQSNQYDVYTHFLPVESGIMDHKKLSEIHVTYNQQLTNLNL